jgi:hypothetical protein
MNNLDDIEYGKLKKIFNRVVPFDSLLDVRFYGNVFCPFHENTNTPSARFYKDEDDIIRLNCFAEHKQFTAFDYVVKILKDNPKKYIEKDLTESELSKLIEIVNSGNDFDDFAGEDFSNEIHNKWADSDEDICKFIDSVYEGYYLEDDNGL